MGPAQLPRPSREKYCNCVSIEQRFTDDIPSTVSNDEFNRMWVMSAISGLMAGAQYFQARDAPS